MGQMESRRLISMLHKRRLLVLPLQSRPLRTITLEAWRQLTSCLPRMLPPLGTVTSEFSCLRLWTRPNAAKKGDDTAAMKAAKETTDAAAKIKVSGGDLRDDYPFTVGGNTITVYVDILQAR